MNVPLSVECTEEHGREKLSIWANGKQTKIDSPILPYFYSYDDLNIPCVRKTRVRKIALSNFQERTFYKFEFNTRKELIKNKVDGKTFEDNIPFTLRQRIDNPDVYTQYAHTNPLNFDYLDIEQYCPKTKLFPDATERLTSISFAGNDRQIKSIYLKADTPSDKGLLEKYKEHYTSPDIEVLYNKSYDLPMIFDRCKANNIDITFFSKNKTRPYVGGKHGLRVEGMVVYDVYDSVERDQSLSGNVPNKGLKMVSDYFGFKSTTRVLKGDEFSESVGTADLVAYNKEDVSRLFYLFDIYWKGIEYTAEDLKIPLSEAVSLSTTDLGIIVLGDLYREHNIVADGTNYERYPEIFQRIKEKESSNYQGALVFIQRKGLFTPLLKADYSSMYPSIAASFNFSPDVCTLLRYERYKKDGFKIDEDERTFTYYIPDNQINKIVVVQTLKQEGFLSKAINKFLKERSEFKEEYKKTDSKIARARSDIAKVKANGGIYGNMGSPNSPFGFAPTAVATTGIGRECAKLLIEVLESLYPGSVIEVDTDGVYFTAENYNEERILTYFNEALEKKFKKKLNLSIDIDEYERGFFHKAKNYILMKKGKVVLHGAAMKASSKDPISKKLINDLAKAKLNNEPTNAIVEKYKNLTVDDFELRDFAMQTTMGRHPNQYTDKGKSHLSYQMALKALKHFSLPLKIGNEYHYVKTTHGYELYQLAKKEDIDVKYYRAKVTKIVEMFQAEYALFTPLNEFLGESNIGWEGENEVSSTIIKENAPSSLDAFL